MVAALLSQMDSILDFSRLLKEMQGFLPDFCAKTEKLLFLIASLNKKVMKC